MNACLKAQTMQQQIHEYCSLSSNNTMNIWLIPITSSHACEYCRQIAPTCSKQMNVTTLFMEIQ